MRLDEHDRKLMCAAMARFKRHLEKDNERIKRKVQEKPQLAAYVKRQERDIARLNQMILTHRSENV